MLIEGGSFTELKAALVLPQDVKSTIRTIMGFILAGVHQEWGTVARPREEANTQHS
jgi:hypothetical protein